MACLHPTFRCRVLFRPPVPSKEAGKCRLPKNAPLRLTAAVGVGALLYIALLPTATAQQDPFATGADDPFSAAAGDAFGAAPADAPPFAVAPADAPPFGAAPADPAAADATATTAPPTGPSAVVVQQLRRYAARGSDDAQLAFAIREAIRLGQVDLAEEFLAELTARDLDVPRLAAMARAIGVALLTRLRGLPGLDQAAIAQINALRSAAATTAADRQRLQALIPQLVDRSVDQRLAAMRGLLAGGDAAIEVMAVAAASPDPPAPRTRIADVLSRMGTGGYEAMQQLALYGTDDFRPGALQSLVRIDRPRAMPELVAALHATGSTAAERSIAGSAIRPVLDALPGPEETERYLLQMLERADRAVQHAALADGTETLWTIGDDRESVTSTLVPSTLAAQRRAVDAARRLRRLGVLSGPSLAAALATDLAYRLQVDPLFGSADDAESVAQAWGSGALAAETLAAAMRLALEQDRHGAAIAAMRLMDTRDALSLVVSGEAQPTALVAAVLHPEPRVRYEAAATIARLDVVEPYAGSSDVLQVWLEMASLQQQPTALVVEPRTVAAQEIASLMGALGYRVEILRTVAEAVRRIDAGGDLRWVVATTELADAPAIELVDRIRRRPLGGTVPILFYGPEAAGDLDDRWQAPVVRIAPPRTASGLARAMQPVLQARLLEPLSSAERQIFAAQGIEFLGAVSTADNRYSFYDLRSSGAEAVVSGTAAAWGPARLAVLSALGTPQSQALLAGLAAQSALSAETRAQAAQAFAGSVKRFGTRLSRDDVALQYERYNRLQDPAAREVMAVVLDAIERRAGVTTRPSPD